MYRETLARLHQRHRTTKYPKVPPTLPDRFRGLPILSQAQCPEGCSSCVDICPTQAIAFSNGKPSIDLGRCLFCTHCTDACPEGHISLSNQHSLAVRSRAELVYDGSLAPKVEQLNSEMLRIFGRSLKLRQVSAGGCNGCEVDINVLSTIVFDLGRFGIQFVASPRHADGILVTGPVTENMKLALLKTYEAVPSPKLVIASGACAISGGPFRDHPEVLNGVDTLIPVDLYIPGCPPHPLTTLDALLQLLGRMEKGKSS